ncbi:MAG: histidine phosphatase family protein [Dehalococcoidales bacterium]|nr:MAG: histidine phosphatase family protein [Dehalococcoidales bacterium]
MAKLLLMRHGLTEFNQDRRFMGHSDIELSTTGRQQAEKLRDYLADEKIDAVYSSDLKRAVEMAEIVCEGRGLDIVTCPELRECNYGTCEGLTFSEINDSYPHVAERCINFTLELEFPEGECFVDFFERTSHFIERLKEHRPSETVLISAHDGPLKILLCRLLEIGDDHWWQLRLNNGSLSIINISPRGAVLSRLNDVSFLSGLGD